uniref:Uncharacterized protein n=1 Tax=Fundulus heteroclitus TaxID=8078 RepID=A0A3Q2SR71_FUNHE
MVLSAQGRDHHSQELLIHMELLRVHNTQFGIGGLDVVQVLHSSFQSTHHSSSMLCHFGVTEDGSRGGEVAERSEMSLSPGIHNQEPDSRDTFQRLIHIHLSPQSCDGLALSICPLNHGDELSLSLVHK